MSTTYDWSQFFGPAQQAIQQWGQRNQYQTALQGLIGNPQFNPVQVTAPVSGPATAGASMPMPNATPLGDSARQAAYNAPAESYSGPLGQQLGNNAAGMMSLLKGLPPGLGLPMLAQTVQGQMERQNKLQDMQAQSDIEAKRQMDLAKFTNQLPMSVAAGQQNAAELQRQEDAAKFNNQLPMTAYQRADLNKPIAMPLGTSLVNPQTGQAIGGSGTMGLPMAGGKMSSNIADYPPQMQGVIRGMLNGTIAPPQGAALRAPQTLQMIEAAAAIDPSFDETKWTARNKMAGDAQGNGAWGKAMNALGTATQHVSALGNYAGDTFSTTLPAANWALNAGASALGGAGPSVYRDTAHKVGEEYTRAYRGAGGSEADIKSSMDALSPNASSRTKDSVIDENMNLARDKMSENVEQYNRTMGTNKKISDFVSPQTAAAYAARGIDINTGNKITAASGSPQIAPAGTKAQGPNGHILTSDGKGGWK